MAKQLKFDWPGRVDFGAENFFVTEANRAALETVMAPQVWPAHKLVLLGPAGSGKTHLSKLFAQTFAARAISARSIEAQLPLPDTALVVDDLHALPGSSEEWLFHAHNHLARARLPLLLASRTAPGRLRIALPDLASRLAATNIARIEDPDEPLLRAVLTKQFTDRQLAPTPAALTWMLRHMERTFAEASRIAEVLDRESLDQGRSITVKFAREILRA